MVSIRCNFPFFFFTRNGSCTNCRGYHQHSIHRPQTSRGAYHLYEKSGWCNRCIMVRDFPNSAGQPDEIALTIYLSGVSSRSSRKRPGNGGFIQMVRNFLPLRSEWKKRSTSEGTPQFSEQKFRKSTLPFDFKPKFPDFLFCFFFFLFFLLPNGKSRSN